MFQKFLCTIALCLGLSSTVVLADEVGVTIDGAQKFQIIDGFGVNVNSASWNNGELRPALDMLVEYLGASIFRVVIDNTDWEASNDNDDPHTFAWPLYRSIYTTPKFKALWRTMAYLNQKGITKNLILSVMGPVPQWMGGSHINDTAEDEWVEMIASLVYYARHTRQLKFGFLAPLNEPDWDGIEGPQVGAGQYVRLLQKLADKLDTLGLTNLHFIGPDTALATTAVGTYFPEMLAHTTVMKRLLRFGIHNYSGDIAGVRDAIRASAYPQKKIWVTEVSNLAEVFPQLLQGASATLVWEAYDSVYQHAVLAGRGNEPPNDAGNGPALLAYDTRIPRKTFFEHRQLFKYVTPGTRRIAAWESQANFDILAFYHPTMLQVTIVGRNAGADVLTIVASLANLPTISTLRFTLTDAAVNGQEMPDVPVTGATFTVTVPAGSTFTLTGIVPPSLTEIP